MSDVATPGRLSFREKYRGNNFANDWVEGNERAVGREKSKNVKSRSKRRGSTP